MTTTLRTECQELWEKSLDKSFHQYFPEVFGYFMCLLRYNTQLNFFSRKITPRLLFIDHILDCALGLVAFESAHVILDFGTGGGLPGIVLATCYPQKKVILYDKSSKKIHYLARMLNELKLKNCKALLELDAKSLKSIDCVASRAVGSVEKVRQLLAELGLEKCRQISYKANADKIASELLECSGNMKNTVLTLQHPLGKERHLVILFAN